MLLVTSLIGLAVAVLVFSRLSLRRTIVKGLDAYRRFSLWLLSLRGLTEEDVAARRIVTGESWEEFCDTLKAAGAAMIASGTPKDSFNQAEGFRYLTRLTRAGLEAFVEHCDDKAPVLHRVAHETVKLGSDNPDNYYQTARISGKYKYRLYGQRGTIDYVSFGTQHGHYGQGGGLPPTGYLEGSDMRIASDGTFEVLLSCTRDAAEEKRFGPNWLTMTPETGTLVVRQTYADRSKETVAVLHIERIDAPHRPSNITCTQLDDGLKTASTFVAGASMMFARWANEFKGHTNKLPLFDPERSNQAGGDPKIRYYHSYWQLATDEALVIDVMPPKCQSWNFQLNNHWMESLDYRYYQIHTNKHLATYRSDGSLRIVVAHTNPGVPNWINTVGHTCGTMCFRWVRADNHPEPQTRVVKLADVPSLA